MSIAKVQNKNIHTSINYFNQKKIPIDVISHIIFLSGSSPQTDNVCTLFFEAANKNPINRTNIMFSLCKSIKACLDRCLKISDTLVKKENKLLEKFYFCHTCTKKDDDKKNISQNKYNIILMKRCLEELNSRLNIPEYDTYSSLKSFLKINKNYLKTNAGHRHLYMIFEIAKSKIRSTKNISNIFCNILILNFYFADSVLDFILKFNSYENMESEVEFMSLMIINIMQNSNAKINHLDRCLDYMFELHTYKNKCWSFTRKSHVFKTSFKNKNINSNYIDRILDYIFKFDFDEYERWPSHIKSSIFECILYRVNSCNNHVDRILDYIFKLDAELYRRWPGKLKSGVFIQIVIREDVKSDHVDRVLNYIKDWKWINEHKSIIFQRILRNPNIEKYVIKMIVDEIFELDAHAYKRWSYKDRLNSLSDIHLNNNLSIDILERISDYIFGLDREEYNLWNVSDLKCFFRHVVVNPNVKPDYVGRVLDHMEYWSWTVKHKRNVFEKYIKNPNAKPDILKNISNRLLKLEKDKKNDKILKLIEEKLVLLQK